MRSLSTRIVVVAVATLSLSLLAYLVIVILVGRAQTRDNMRRFAQIELELVRNANREDGKAGMAATITHLDRTFGSTHFVVNGAGIDVLTGEDRSRLLRSGVEQTVVHRTVAPIWRFLRGGVGMSAHCSIDGQLCLITFSHPWETVSAQLPYLVALLIGVAVLYSIVGLRIVIRLRAIASAASRFGDGDLDARVERAGGEDELGEVSRSFNGMADRVRSLVLSQRQLLQDVSHELRSPLARLAFAAELARTAADRGAAIDEITKHLRFLTELVASLLQLTRAEGDAGVRHDQRIEPARVVADVAGMLTLNATERGVAIRVVADTPRQVIVGDLRLVNRALDNVLRNAIQYAPVGSPIDLEIRELEHRVAFSVRDYGPGVPESMINRIFEPFVRVDESRQQATGGVGLGLSIVRRVVQVHHGTLRAENAKPGLRVTLEFPSVDRPVGVSGESQPAA